MGTENEGKDYVASYLHPWDLSERNRLHRAKWQYDYVRRRLREARNFILAGCPGDWTDSDKCRR